MIDTFKRLKFSQPSLLLLLGILMLFNNALFAQVVPHNLLPPKPNPPKLVNDYADLLTPDEERRLEQKLVAYDNSTSNQVVIVTVKTMRGYEADQYATEIGHFWGVGGQAKYDNGVVILVSDGTEENGKRRYFIATGYGLEGAMPAIITNAIAQEFLVPNLKSNNYFDAFDQTTSAVIKAAAGEYKAPDNYGKRKGGGSGGGGAFAFIILIIIIILIINRNNRGGGGGFMSRRGYRSGFPPIIFPGGWGSSSGGSSWGGGSSGGGSFGGFGGGGFGGGGSGGSW